MRCVAEDLGPLRSALWLALWNPRMANFSEVRQEEQARSGACCMYLKI